MLSTHRNTVVRSIGRRFCSVKNPAPSSSFAKKAAIIGGAGAAAAAGYVYFDSLQPQADSKEKLVATKKVEKVEIAKTDVEAVKKDANVAIVEAAKVVEEEAVADSKVAELEAGALYDDLVHSTSAPRVSEPATSFESAVEAISVVRLNQESDSLLCDNAPADAESECVDIQEIEDDFTVSSPACLTPEEPEEEIDIVLGDDASAPALIEPAEAVFQMKPLQVESCEVLIKLLQSELPEALEHEEDTLVPIDDLVKAEMQLMEGLDEEGLRQKLESRVRALATHRRYHALRVAQTVAEFREVDAVRQEAREAALQEHAQQEQELAVQRATQETTKKLEAQAEAALQDLSVHMTNEKIATVNNVMNELKEISDKQLEHQHLGQLEYLAQLKGRLSSIDEIFIRVFTANQAALMNNKVSMAVVDLENALAESLPTFDVFRKLEKFAHDPITSQILNALPAAYVDSKEPVSSLARLQTSFKDALYDMKFATFIQPEMGMLGHIIGKVFASLYIIDHNSLPVSTLPANKTEANLHHLARASYYIDRSQFLKAMECLEHLDGMGRKAAEPWLAEARRSMTMHQTCKILKARVASVTHSL